MKVLHLLGTAGPHPAWVSFLRSSDRERFDFTVGSLDASGPLQSDMAALGVRTFALGAHHRRAYPAAAIRLARRLRRERVDVVQGHLLDGALVALCAARLARAPLAVFTAHHSHEMPLLDRPALLAVDRAIAGPLCDLIIAPSLEMKRTLVELHGVAAEKVEVVHHGVDIGRLDPARADGTRVRAELGLEGATVIGTIARLYWIKNLRALVEAFAEVAGADRSLKLLIVGAGDQSELRSVAADLGLSQRVVFTGPRGDIPDVLAAMDIYAHAALAESFGLAIVEAMAAARPVVTTPVGIAREVVDHGRNGLLTAGTDRSHLARALAEMLSRRAQWSELGAAARRRVLGFTVPAMAAEHERLYQERQDAGVSRRRSR